MKLKKALNEFEKLKQKHAEGKLNDKKFEKEISKISAYSDDDTEWKVDVEGNWYRKYKGEWVKDSVKLEKPSNSPQTLFQLLVMIIKGLFTNLPKKLLCFFIIGVVTFLVHTYLVIFPNGGFWPGTNPTLDKILALVGNEARGTIFWSILGYLATSVIRRMVSMGPKKFIGGIFIGPVRVVKSMFGKTGRFISFFMVSMAVFLLLAQFLIKNTFIAYTLIVGAILGIVTFRSDLSYLILRLGFQDVTRLFKRKDAKFNDIYFDAYQLAIIAAMLIYSFLHKKPLFIYAICIFAVAMVIFAKFRKTNKVAANLFMLGTVGLNMAIIYMIKAYADDGGVAEAGGIKNWVGSQGAGTAVLIGLPPGIGSGVGGIIGIITGGGEFVNTFDENIIYGEDEELPEVELEETPEDITEEEISDEIEEIEEATDEVEEVSEEPESEEETEEEAEAEEAEEETEEEAEAEEETEEEGYTKEDLLGAAEDIYDLIFGTPEEKLDSVISLGELGYELPGELGDLISSAQDFVLTSAIVSTIFEKYEGLVPDWFTEGAEQTANEAWDYMGIAKDLFGDYLPEGSPISDIMDWAGIAKDALDNIGMGDNAVYAGIKSYLSNKIKSLAFDTKLNNPSALGLVVMDMLTTILAGGTKAGDIISPGKTIQGGANFIIDKLTDLYNGTDDVSKRLKDGKYGGTWKVADDTTEFIADAVYNPDEFKKDWENVVTSDEFYNDMYKTNEDLWKPAEGSWAVKRAGCYVGQKATEQFINVAKGVKDLSSWLGSWI